MWTRINFYILIWFTGQIWRVHGGSRKSSVTTVGTVGNLNIGGGNTRSRIYNADIITKSRKNASNMTQSHINGKGIVMCVSHYTVFNAMRLIYQTKRILMSPLPVTLYHCNDMEANRTEEFITIDPTLKIIDLCPGGFPYAESLKPQLRTYQCKMAALLESKYNETMIVDVEVIWLQEPSHLFYAPGYTQTKTLFFRENAHKWRKTSLGPMKLTNYFESQGITLNPELIAKYARRNDVNFWWRYLESDLNQKVFPYPGHFTDTSVVLVDKRRHRGMLEIIKKNFVSWNLGLGDKEIYWTSAFIAGESSYFEPYLAGQYGNCHGVRMHFDPRFQNENDAKPYFLNVENNRVSRITYVGMNIDTMQQLQKQQVGPYLIRLKMNDTLYENFDKRVSKGCTCSKFECKQTIYGHSILQSYLHTQWIYLALQLKSKLEVHTVLDITSTTNSNMNQQDILEDMGEKKSCIPVSTKHRLDVYEMLNKLLLPTDCSLVGCVNTTMIANDYLYFASRLESKINNNNNNNDTTPTTWRRLMKEKTKQLPKGGHLGSIGAGDEQNEELFCIPISFKNDHYPNTATTVVEYSRYTTAVVN